MTSSANSLTAVSSHSSGFTFDGQALWKLVKRRRTSIVLGVAIGWALGLAYFFLAPVKYESATEVLVMQKDQKMAKGDSADQVQTAINEDILSTHMQILRSREIVGSALKAGGFDQLPSIVNHLKRDQSPTTFVIDGLTVTRGGTGQSRLAHVLNVSFRHTSESESKEILEAVVASYKKFLGDKFQDVGQEAASLITRAKVDLANDLKGAEERYREFREKAPLLWKNGESANVHQVRYEELNAALSASRLHASKARARLKVVEDAIAEQDARGAEGFERLALLDHNDFERLGMLIDIDKGDSNSAEFQSTLPQRTEMARAQHQSILELVLKQKSRAADLGPDHPEMQQLNAQIKEAQSFISAQSARLGDVEKKAKLTPKTIVQAYRELLKQDVATMDRQQIELNKAADTAQEEAKALVVFELRGEALRKEIDRVQSLYDAVLERLREINLVKDYGGFVTEVIAPAELGKKVSPRGSISLLFGTFVGLVIAAGAVGAAELRDRSFHDVDALASAVRVPVLSTVPLMDPETLDEETTERVAETQRSHCLTAYFRPKSRDAEVFRGLRTSVFFSGKNKTHRIIACSSPAMGDGKTTVISNLAISIAQSGRSVLLVDCDLRRPRIHELFHLSNEVGLSDIVSSATDPQDAIQTIDVENLSLLTSGPIPANPAELLSSVAFNDFLDMVRERYDYVLLDCPPVLAVSDPCVVAPKADAVLVIVRLENNTRSQVIRAVDMLQELDTKVTGLVVNCVLAAASGGDYGSGKYGYGYGYGGDPNSKYYEEGQATAPSGRARGGKKSSGPKSETIANGREIAAAGDKSGTR
jgi:succinoglycan biosynthesis transport protein ExoP